MRPLKLDENIRPLSAFRAEVASFVKRVNDTKRQDVGHALLEERVCMDDVRVRARPSANVRRLTAALTMLLAPLVLVACATSGDGGSANGPSLADVPTEESQLTQAVEQLYPGFEIVEFLGKDGGVHYLTARRDTVPSFVVRLAFIKGADWSESATIDGTKWSTDGLLSEAASDSALLTGALQTQTLESIAADAGLAGGADGRYVHEISTVSNVEVIAFVLEPDGRYSSYRYRLDMGESPHRFVLESKAENR
ncbi:MAG: hypothetical protein JXP37_09870 [Coriobacteriia bacterium]|nr:hypothetical protein [Coriobacteriia bacterium]